MECDSDSLSHVIPFFALEVEAYLFSPSVTTSVADKFRIDGSFFSPD